MSKIHYSIDGEEVTIEVYEGERYSEKTDTIETQVFSLADCPAELKDGEGHKTFAAYGLLKWLQDRTSQVKGAGDKLAAMVVEFEEKALAGLWKAPAKERSTASRSSRRKITASLAQAVGDLLGLTTSEAEANLKALSKEQFDGLVANPKVVDKVAELDGAAAAPSEGALADLLG